MTDRTYKLEFINKSPVLELSAPGPAGPAGLGIQIVDRLASTEDLPDVNSNELKPGDAYIIDGKLYVFTRARSFEVQNFVAGADGKDGKDGAPGRDGRDGLNGGQGPRGADGQRGSRITSGPNNPVTTGTELPGDIHVNTTTGVVYEWQ